MWNNLAIMILLYVARTITCLSWFLHHLSLKGSQSNCVEEWGVTSKSQRFRACMRLICCCSTCPQRRHLATKLFSWANTGWITCPVSSRSDIIVSRCIHPAYTFLVWRHGFVMTLCCCAWGWDRKGEGQQRAQWMLILIKVVRAGGCLSWCRNSCLHH